MRNLVFPSISFLAGVAAAAVFFLSRSAELTDIAAPNNLHEQTISASNRSTSAAASVAGSQATFDTTRKDRGPTREQIQSDYETNGMQQVAAQNAEDPYSSDKLIATGNNNPGTNSSADTTPKRSPLPIADELEPFFEDGSDAADFHDEMEEQDRDESWAQYMESQIAAFLTSKPALSTFQIASIHCRASMCEVQAIGYGPEADVTWFIAVADLPNQPWAVEFNGGAGSFEMREFGPDVLSILMQLGRKKGDSTTNSVEQMISAN